MKKFEPIYKPKEITSHGYVKYNKDNHRVWNILYDRQLLVTMKNSCYLHAQGIDILHYSHHLVPQLPLVNKILLKTSGWRLQLVNTIVEMNDFFVMLSEKKFPVICHIRPMSDLNYIPEPDCFHELYGHTPFLLNEEFGNYLQYFATLFLNSSPIERFLLQRYFWFTIEFGLIKEFNRLKILGAGILASHDESIYAIKSELPVKVDYDPLSIFRTPFRMDLPQPIYYVLPSLDILQKDLSRLKMFIEKALELGEFKPLFRMENLNLMNLHSLQHAFD